MREKKKCCCGKYLQNECNWFEWFCLSLIISSSNSAQPWALCKHVPSSFLSPHSLIDVSTTLRSVVIVISLFFFKLDKTRTNTNLFIYFPRRIRKHTIFSQRKHTITSFYLIEIAEFRLFVCCYFFSFFDVKRGTRFSMWSERNLVDNCLYPNIFAQL